MFESVIAYGEKLDWNYWTLIYLCNFRNKPYNWFVSSTTFPNHLFISVFHHILSTKPVWFLITIHTSQTVCNQCNQNNGIIFSSLPSFISYSCHINTWLNRWKPGFVALRRFLSSISFNIIKCQIYLIKMVLVKNFCLQLTKTEKKGPFIYFELNWPSFVWVTYL